MSDAMAAAGTSGKAIFSLVLGLLALVCLHSGGLPALLVGLIFAAAPAVLLGFLGLREINASDGRLKGRSVAITGMIIGAFSSAAFLLWLFMVILGNLQEKSNRVRCQHNLANIGQAVLLYYDRQQPEAFPPGSIIRPELPIAKRLSWLVSILPHLKLGSLAKEFDLEKPWDDEANRAAVDTVVHGFLCPADLDTASAPRPAITQYVGFAGLGADAAQLSVKETRAGFFGYERVISRENVTAGTSETMMAAETALDNGPWAAAEAAVRGLDPAQKPYIGPGRPFGGLHARGLNVLWADGSVRFVTADIKPEVFAIQTTIAREKDMLGD